MSSIVRRVFSASPSALLNVFEPGLRGFEVVENRNWNQEFAILAKTSHWGRGSVNAEE